MITFDNTTLSDFKRCMRYGYFRHVRGWTEDKVNPALLFGVAWHKAMSAIWSGTPQDAYEAFLSSWVEGGGPLALTAGQAKQYGSRTLPAARKLLAEYARVRSNDVSRVTVVSDEEFFLAPIDSHVSYCGTIDKVLRSPDGYIILEHKTTAYGSSSGFAVDWLESWRLNSQVDGYIFSVRQRYTDAPVSAVIDATLVSSRGMAFEFVPVRRTDAQIKAWLAHTEWWISRILESWGRTGFPYASWTDQTNERNQFFPSPPNDILKEFPLNTEGCLKYGKRCPYWNICVMHTQPHSIENPPYGFVQLYWRPQDDQAK